jgi:CDP-paratose 2-epimerase
MFILLSTSRVYSMEVLRRVRVSMLSAELPGGRRLERFELAGPLPRGLTLDGIGEDLSTEPPLSLYGCSKRSSELVALEYGRQYEFPVWINRCGVMAGAGQFGHPGQGIVAYWIHAHREGRSLQYVGFDGMGRQVRDVVHPRDLMPLLDAQMLERRIEHGLPRVLNIGGGREHSFSLAELTRWCRERFPDTRSPYPDAISVNRANDLPWVVLDCGMAQRVWDWRPRTPMERIFEEVADFAEAHPQWLASLEP